MIPWLLELSWVNFIKNKVKCNNIYCYICHEILFCIILRITDATNLIPVAINEITWQGGIPDLLPYMFKYQERSTNAGWSHQTLQMDSSKSFFFSTLTIWCQIRVLLKNKKNIFGFWISMYWKVLKEHANNSWLFNV